MYWHLSNREDKCNIKNNLKLLLEMPTCQVELAPVSKEMEILHSSEVQEWLSPVFIDCSSVIPFTEWLKEGASLPFRKWKPPTPPKWRGVSGQGDRWSLILILENISQSVGYCCLKPNMVLDFQIFSDLEKIKHLHLQTIPSAKNWSQNNITSF